MYIVCILSMYIDHDDVVLVHREQQKAAEAEVIMKVNLATEVRSKSA